MKTGCVYTRRTVICCKNLRWYLALVSIRRWSGNKTSMESNQSNIELEERQDSATLVNGLQLVLQSWPISRWLVSWLHRIVQPCITMSQSSTCYEPLDQFVANAKVNPIGLYNVPSTTYNYIATRRHHYRSLQIVHRDVSNMHPDNGCFPLVVRWEGIE